MTFSTELKALAVLPEPNQPPHLEFLVVDHQGHYSYPEAIAQLKDCGYMSLVDMQELSHTDLNNVFEEMAKFKYQLVKQNLQLVSSIKVETL